MDFDQVRRNFQNYGFQGTMHDLGLKFANQFMYVRIFNAVSLSLEDINRNKYLDVEVPYEKRFLTTEEIKKFAADPQYDMPHSFLDRALAKGDRCFGFIDGEVLAAYGWYSRKPTQVSQELDLHFNDAYVYMYRGFTHPNYRGKRLHGIGMASALEAFTKMGCKGIISYVESNNYNSLRSCYRMGYKDVGKVHIVKMFGRHLIRHCTGCKDEDFKIIPKELPRHMIARAA